MKSGLLALLFTTSILPALALADDVQPPAKTEVVKGDLIFRDQNLKTYFDGLYEPTKETTIKWKSNGKDGAPPVDLVSEHYSEFESKDSLDRSNCVLKTEAAQNIVKLFPSPNSNMPLTGASLKVDGPAVVWRFIVNSGNKKAERVLYTYEGALEGTNNKDFVIKILCRAEVYTRVLDQRSSDQKKLDASYLIEQALEKSGIHRKTPRPILEYERLNQLNLSEDKVVPTQA